MNQYFAYIRVSTARQGEQGVSLEQQRDAIAHYAQRNHMEVAQWYEEQETAARAWSARLRPDGPSVESWQRRAVWSSTKLIAAPATSRTGLISAK